MKLTAFASTSAAMLVACFLVTNASATTEAARVDDNPGAATPVLAQADAASNGRPAEVGAGQKSKSKSELQEVVVTGTVAEGYKVEVVQSVGPLGETKLLDTPFSINVMSADLLENLHANTADDIYRANPLLQTWTSATRSAGGSANPVIRGFTTSNSSGRAEDGVRADLSSTAIVDKQQVEVLTGLSGFLYGPASVGGMINYVNKRPTPEPLTDLTVGTYGGNNVYAHMDAGGPIDAGGRFGYRVNALLQGGDTAVQDAEFDRRLVTAAFDFHVTEDLLLQALGGYDYSHVGIQPFWFVPGNLRHPQAPDASKNYAQPFTESTNRTRKGSFGLKWHITDAIGIRASYRHAVDDGAKRDQIFANNTVTSETTYSQTLIAPAPQKKISDGGSLLADLKFSTGPVEHLLTAGYFANRSNYEHMLGDSGFFFGTVLPDVDFSAPLHIDKPSVPLGPTGPWTSTDLEINRNWVFGDSVRLGEHWSAVLGLNRATITENGYDSTTGAQTNAYSRSKVTPNVSLVFKPFPYLTTYATYIQALEEGAVVPNTGPQIFTNAGEVLPPSTDSQYEVGAKAEVGGMLLTAALFKIDRALQATLANSDGTFTYIQSGREVHKGVEFVVSGRVTESFSLYGGFTALDPTIVNQPDNPT